MTETGLASIKLDDGSSLEIKNIYGASILVANREKAYDWLREHGHDDIIRRVKFFFLEVLILYFDRLRRLDT